MRPAAIGVILNPSRTKVLLVKRHDVPVWVLPGGGIDPDETPELAVCRELKEETGLQVEIVRKVAEYFPINTLAKETHLFECRALTGALTSSPETPEVAYFPLVTLPKDLFLVHQAWLQDALLPSSTILKKPITQVTYTNLFFYFLRHPFQVLRFAYTRFSK